MELRGKLDRSRAYYAVRFHAARAAWLHVYSVFDLLLFVQVYLRVCVSVQQQVPAYCMWPPQPSVLSLKWFAQPYLAF